jgi:hypothetical protein
MPRLTLTHTLALPIALLMLAAFVHPIWAASATFSLTPATKTAAVGDIFSVTITLDSGGNSVTGARAIILYEPAKVQVVDASGNAAPQITYGSGIFTNPTVLTNAVDASQGKIELDLAESTTATPIPFTGVGTYGSFYLKALATGTTNLAFSFTPGSSTTGSLVSIANATNVLGSVSSAAYTISAADNSNNNNNNNNNSSGNNSSGSSNPTPTPTPNPLPKAGFETPFIALVGLATLLIFSGIIFIVPTYRPRH